MQERKINESDQSVLKDQKSWDILKHIDYDFDQFKDVKMSYYGILGRAKVIDEEIRNLYLYIQIVSSYH